LTTGFDLGGHLRSTLDVGDIVNVIVSIGGLFSQPQLSGLLLRFDEAIDSRTPFVVGNDMGASINKKIS
jgi:hypothetical protein